MAYSIDRDRIMNKKELYRLPKKDQKALLNHWRLCYDTETIKKELGLSTTAFYSLLKRLGLPTNLKAHRDASPSLLGGDVETPKIDSKVDSSLSNEIKCQIGLIGHVKINELTDVLQFAREHDLEVSLKTK